MASQAIKTILAQLRTQIDTDVTALKLVTDDVLGSHQIADSKFPACFIQEVGSEVSHAITATADIQARVILTVLYKGGEDAARDIIEAIIDSLKNDAQIGTTCISALVLNESPPMNWIEEPSVKFRDVVVLIRYWRDY